MCRVQGGYPGFFIGGGASLRNAVNLVSCFFFLFFASFFSQNTIYFRKPQVISGGGDAHPLHLSPKSAPEVCKMTNVLGLETDVWGFGRIMQTPLLSR